MVFCLSSCLIVTPAPPDAFTVCCPGRRQSAVRLCPSAMRLYARKLVSVDRPGTTHKQVAQQVEPQAHVGYGSSPRSFGAKQQAICLEKNGLSLVEFCLPKSRMLYSARQSPERVGNTQCEARTLDCGRIFCASISEASIWDFSFLWAS